MSEGPHRSDISERPLPSTASPSSGHSSDHSPARCGRNPSSGSTWPRSTRSSSYHPCDTGYASTPTRSLKLRGCRHVECRQQHLDPPGTQIHQHGRRTQISAAHMVRAHQVSGHTMLRQISAGIGVQLAAGVLTRRCAAQPHFRRENGFERAERDRHPGCGLAGRVRWTRSIYRSAQGFRVTCHWMGYPVVNVRDLGTLPR
jgi:hypothetical protein